MVHPGLVVVLPHGFAACKAKGDAGACFRRDCRPNATLVGHKLRFVARLAGQARLRLYFMMLPWRPVRSRSRA
jgi:hypothetical protein